MGPFRKTETEDPKTYRITYFPNPFDKDPVARTEDVVAHRVDTYDGEDPWVRFLRDTPVIRVITEEEAAFSNGLLTPGEEYEYVRSDVFLMIDIGNIARIEVVDD